jgi:hypothetical protein
MVKFRTELGIKGNSDITFIVVTDDTSKISILQYIHALDSFTTSYRESAFDYETMEEIMRQIGEIRAKNQTNNLA